MKRLFAFWMFFFFVLAVGSAALAGDDQVSSAMKQILDHRADNFSAIRKDPHGDGDETVYASSVIVPGAEKCYIAPAAKPHYSDECSVLETKSRAALNTGYKKYVKALQNSAPASWKTWSESSVKPPGESTFTGPDRTHPAAVVRWTLEGMNMDWYDLTVTFYAEGYTESR